MIVSTRISDKYHIFDTESGRPTLGHQVGSQAGEGPDIWVCLFKVLWLSHNLKCDLFQPHFALQNPFVIARASHELMQRYQPVHRQLNVKPY